MFKKIICMAVAFICLIMVWSVNKSQAFNGYNGSIETYYNSYSSSCDINNGNTLLQTGKAICVEERVSPESVLNHFNAKLCFVEQTSTSINYYAYSNMFSAYKMVKGKRVNLHISVSKNSTKIGTPIIFGSF